MDAKIFQRGLRGGVVPQIRAPEVTKPVFADNRGNTGKVFQQGIKQTRTVHLRINVEPVLWPKRSLRLDCLDEERIKTLPFLVVRTHRTCNRVKEARLKITQTEHRTFPTRHVRR